MIKRNGGRIISISSQAGTVALRGEAIYYMSKAAINHLTRCLAAEWARYDVNRIADVHPHGWYSTFSIRCRQSQSDARPHSTRPDR